jgi:multiple sugar transport system permease protein
LGVTAVFIFLYCWNEFVLALTLLRSTQKFTLTLQIFSLVGGRYSVEWDHVMAATLLASAPVAVVFASLQRYLVRGLALGAVK